MTFEKYFIARFFYYAGMLLVGVTTVRPVLDLTASDWLFLAAMLTAIPDALAKREDVLVLPRLLILGVALFIIGSFASSAFSAYPDKTLIQAAKFIYLSFLWFLLGAVILFRLEHIRTALFCFVLSAVINGIGAIIQIKYGNVIPNSEMMWNRMTGFAGHPNALGSITAIAMVPTLFFLFQKKSTGIFRITKWLLLLVCVGLALSVSVGAVLSAFAGIIYWLHSSGLRKRQLVWIYFVVALSVVAVVFIGKGMNLANLADRFTHLMEASDVQRTTVGSRMDTYKDALGSIAENPLIGKGAGGELDIAASGFRIHNILLLFWYQFGVFGEIAILLIVTAVLNEIWMIKKSVTNAEVLIINSVLLCSFLTFLINAMAEPVFMQRFGWSPSALAVALSVLVRRQQRGEEINVLGEQAHV